MTSSQVRDQDLDRPRVQAQRCVQPSGTNRACGLAYFNFKKHDFTRRQDASVFGCVAVLFNPQGFPAFAGGHRGAVIPVPIPNTEVKRPFAEGSVGPAHARVGRRRLFYTFESRPLSTLTDAPRPRENFSCWPRIMLSSLRNLARFTLLE